MTEISRHLQPIIEEWLFRGKLIILYGARQVGKTTLSKKILNAFGNQSDYFNCEIASVNQLLQSRNPLELKQLIGNSRLVVFDEAQHVTDIGLILKLLHDTYPEIQIIATGSSSFSLSNNISEPLTGRAVEFLLHPFSYAEISQAYSPVERLQMLPFILRYGLYPEITLQNEKDARFLLDNLTGKYLFRDILSLGNLKKPEMLTKLLKLLAFQVGNEVSMNELSVNLGVSRKLVEHYIDILEKSFILFRLSAFSRNLRQEITKKVKIYFYDLGIRNSIISAFNPIDLRTDIGSLWENFCIIERIKYLQRSQQNPNQYFWRTHKQQEIDYLEEENNQIGAYEFKFTEKKSKIPVLFNETYPDSEFKMIHKNNFMDFIS